jgi:Ca2+-binding RTX toxin-like protein
MSNDSLKLYKFTIVSGTVTAAYKIKNSEVEQQNIDSDESWSVVGTDVVKTKFEHGRIETSIYSDVDGDGIYVKTSEAHASSSGVTSGQFGHSFDIVDGQIRSVYEVKNGVSKLETVSFNESWAVQGTDIIKTEAEHGVLETTTYTDVDGDGIYLQLTKTYTDASTGLALTGGQHGNDSDDRWNGSGNDDYYYGGLGNDYLSGGNGIDNLNGGAGNDILIGGSGDDFLYSAAGDDQVDGGAGNDLIIGGDGAGNDIYNGGTGIDTVKYTSAVAGISVDLSKGLATSVYKPSKTSDTAGIGNDKFVSIENAIAGNYNDILTGNSSNNKFEAGAGNDSIYGGLGKDALFGGSGNDNFIYKNIAESGLTASTRDAIGDFMFGDKIDLSAIDAKLGAGKNDAFTFIGASSALTTANANGALWFNNGILYGSTDKDLAAEFQIELVGVSSVSSVDFIL